MRIPLTSSYVTFATRWRGSVVVCVGYTFECVLMWRDPRDATWQELPRRSLALPTGDGRLDLQRLASLSTTYRDQLIATTVGDWVDEPGDELVIKTTARYLPWARGWVAIETFGSREEYRALMLRRAAQSQAMYRYKHDKQVVLTPEDLARWPGLVWPPIPFASVESSPVPGIED